MGYDVLERSDDPERFESEASKYCESRGLDYRYLRSFRTYQELYSGRLAADASFLVHRAGAVRGVVYAPLEQRDGGTSITVGGSYVPAPAVDDESVEKAAFAHLEAVARAAAADRIALHSCPSTHRWEWNRLRAYGYLDTTTLDAVVDLTLDEATLWRSVRGSYHALINKYTDGAGCSVLVHDAANPDRALHETYRRLHAKAAGRMTRDKASFDLQYEMLCAGDATLIALASEGEIAGCAYFLHHGGAADYFSMADDPDLADRRLPISHVVVWAAVRHFRARGFRLLRLSPPAGFSTVEGFGDYAEPKALGIAHFKHGMATGLAPQFRGVRYFTEDAFAGDLEAFRTAVTQEIAAAEGA